MAKQDKTLFQQMFEHERQIFYALYLIAFVIIAYLLTEVYALSLQTERLDTDHISHQKGSLRIQLTTAIKSKREMTLALALSSSQSIKVDNRGRIDVKESQSKLRRISKGLKVNRVSGQTRFKVIDAQGVCIFRSWSPERGDKVDDAQRWLAQMYQSTSVKEFMDVGENSLLFKAIVPIMHQGVTIGMVEVTTLFDSVVKDLKTSDEELVAVIDRRYRQRLTHPSSKEFVAGYNIVNAEVLSKKMLRDIQGDTLSYLVGTRLKSQKRPISDEYLIVTAKVKAWDHSDLAYLLYFKKRQGSHNTTIKRLEVSTLHIKIILFSIIVLLGLALLMRFLFARYHKDLRVYDELTELRNKTKLMELLAQSSEEQMLIIANVNNFSNINIVYDFEMGDQILQAIAKRLASICGCIEVFRIDADEFGLLYGDVSAEVMIKKIQDQFNEHEMRFGKHSINVTFTYGAASGEEHLFRMASFALRKAKSLGSNRYHIYDSKLDRLDHGERSEFLRMSNLLHNALENDHIVPHYQGIRDNRSKEITKFEALVRIEHEGKILSPYLFIEVAQTTGMITRITQQMIEKTFAYMSKRPYTFSINITEDDLNKNYLIGFLEEMLQKHQIAPERVTLEILEGISSSGNTSNTDQFQAFKKMGLKLAIDDFGAEYSNFERVLDLDADFLKIDAKYIKDIDVNPKSYEITKSIASFAKNTGILCIAEFVSSAKIQAIIDEFGIEYSQGFYFAEPKSFIVDRKKKRNTAETSRLHES